SRGEFLYPGDLFGSGTVGGGCGLELDRYLKPGDVVELEILPIGILRTTIAAQN
ncbi:MAG TPA: fumarylacetoacetate hydrolase, partial [Nitrospira sp.]|nr:fumarylacetoacetate hydrolase [Nitrospira sp.]